MLLDKFSHQMMKIGDLLVRSRERVINHKMNCGRVPDPRDTHLAKHFDSEWTGAVLSHREAYWNHGNVSRPLHLLCSIGSAANDPLREDQRIIAQEFFTQLPSASGET